MGEGVGIRRGAGDIEVSQGVGEELELGEK